MENLSFDTCPPLPGVEAALRRAAQRARELARQTHTPLVVYKDGKIERQTLPDTLTETRADLAVGHFVKESAEAPR